MVNMAQITLEKIKKIYPNGFEAVHELSLHVDEGEFMVLVGPSGCGKTTALRMVAGIEDITEGTLRIGNRVVNETPPKDRDIAMVFQNYALYPNMTVAENIGFALKLRKIAKDEIHRRVEDAMNILGLADWADRKPSELSGGQRQRVAMGRALVREPAVFLMDEPLSNLDAKLRVQMRAEVMRIQRRLDVATLYVTHDQTEAMTMGDRVAVMCDGLVQQCDRPQVLYDDPHNMFVAAFIGSPAMNLFEATLSDNKQIVNLGNNRISIPEELLVSHPKLKDYSDRKLVIGIRPESLTPCASLQSTVLMAQVDLIEALGSEMLIHFQIGAKRIVPESAYGKDVEGLGAGGINSHGEGVARVGPRTEVKVGQSMLFSVDVQSLHFFDSISGIAL